MVAGELDEQIFQPLASLRIGSSILRCGATEVGEGTADPLRRKFGVVCL